MIGETNEQERTRQYDILRVLLSELNPELNAWLHERFTAMWDAVGQRPFVSGLRISPPLAEWEAGYFVAGLQSDLFHVDEHGVVQSGLLMSAEEGRPPDRPYRIFSSEPPRLLRENLCQLAAAARLVFERGWLPRQISLEPGRVEHHTTADSFDLLIRAPSGAILIWAEVRRSSMELEKLVADLQACSRRGRHAQVDCGFPQNHPRHEFAVENQPGYLWLVAPEADFCLRLHHAGESVQFELLGSLPPRSHLE
jgi:hypothetical protein